MLHLMSISFINARPWRPLWRLLDNDNFNDVWCTWLQRHRIDRWTPRLASASLHTRVLTDAHVLVQARFEGTLP